MVEFLGFNMLGDLYALNPMPTNLQNITNVKIENGKYDHLWISRDALSDYPEDIPTVWDYTTILNATFNGTLHAGNIDFIGSQITMIRIKRRVKGDFTWMTLMEIPVNKVSDLQFIVHDNLNKYGVTYEYAFVPVLGDQEANYITNEIYSEFNGVFICDTDTIFKYYYDVKYGTFTRQNKATVFEPLGRRYPVVVSNALINYTTGTIEGTVITDASVFGQQIDRVADVVNRDKLLDFLVNKKAKIVKDSNSNIWLIVVTGAPQIKYDNNIGQGVAAVSFNFAEVGDANNSNDLYNSGLIDLSTGGLS